jgi:hypothetical protein
MSTAGKILVVLVMLVVPLWMVMTSHVAELNKRGGEQVEKLTKDVEKLEKDVAEAQKSLVALKDQISLDQVAMTDHLAVLRSYQADLQKARSESIEFATRAKYQLDSTLAAVKSAEATRDLRATEKTQEIKALADTQAEVEQLKQEHATLVEQLNTLRRDFKATVDSNRKIVERVKSARSS